MKRLTGLCGAAVLVAGVWAGAGRMALEAQGRGGGAAAPQPAATAAVPGSEWRTYGADLASTRYSPADQINKDNFKNLEIAWRLNTNPFGPRPDNLYSATPLMVKGTLYTTVGSRRGVAALDPGTGEIRWLHTEDEGVRGQNAPRNGSGRGVEYWASADGRDERIIYVTPGYRMIALNAKTGVPVPSFGTNGVIDLKQDFDQKIENLDTADVGLNATPIVVGDVVVVGAAHRFAGARGTNTVKGYVRAFDVRTGKRIWTFHTIPQKGEFGYDTWLNNSADINGNTGVWSQMSADLELGLVYLPVEMPPSDFFGGGRPGNSLYSESLVAVDVKTGKRKWHYQTIHHGLWDWDLSCAPILFDLNMNGRRIKALAQPTKSAFLFVLNRETGEPIWPIEERPVPQSEVPSEKTSPTQPFPTKPKPFDRQGFSLDDVLDFTPELHREGLEVVKRYRIGPIFTPPALEQPGGPAATLMLPADVGGANWPGGALDPETNRLYIHSHTSVYSLPNVAPDLAAMTPGTPYPAAPGRGGAPGGGRAGAGGPGAVAGGGPAGARGGVPGGPGAPGGRAGGPAGRGAGPGAGPAAGGGRGGTTVQGLPLVKPPYDRITAYDMNSGEMLWQKAHSSTPDAIKNHPALKGLNLPRLGASGRIFIGVLVTKNLVIAGDGGTFTNAKGETVALLRAYDKATGEDIAGEVTMPAKQTGSPMTYMHNGKQYIVIAVGGSPSGAELIAYALP